MEMIRKVGRAVWVEVDLDAMTHNVKLLKKLSKNPSAGMIAVVKANGMGHGAIIPSRHLKKIGVERLAVATVEEGKELREANIGGPIHLLGNVQHYEIIDCLKHDLISTVVDKEAILEMSNAIKSTENKRYENGESHVGLVDIKVDTGMSRNGCQAHELQGLITFCKECDVQVDGIFTHLACWDTPEFNKKQMDLFYDVIKPYRNSGIHFHASNSGGSMVESGSDLDFIRPGISIFGAPPSNNKEIMQTLGFKPTMAIRGTPTLIKHLPAGRKIGYDATHTCETDSWIATFPIGYADGLWRAQGRGKGNVIREKTGEKCPIVGRVSMDAVTVEVPEGVSKEETFTFLSADYDPVTSVVPFSEIVGSIPHDVLTKFTPRLPRIYLSEGQEPIVTQLTTSYATK